jgi:hypothetical protein
MHDKYVRICCLLIALALLCLPAIIQSTGDTRDRPTQFSNAYDRDGDAAGLKFAGSYIVPHGFALARDWQVVALQVALGSYFPARVPLYKLLCRMLR